MEHCTFMSSQRCNAPCTRATHNQHLQGPHAAQQAQCHPGRQMRHGTSGRQVHTASKRITEWLWHVAVHSYVTHCACGASANKPPPPPSNPNTHHSAVIGSDLTLPQLAQVLTPSKNMYSSPLLNVCLDSVICQLRPQLQRRYHPLQDRQPAHATPQRRC